LERGAKKKHGGEEEKREEGKTENGSRLLRSFSVRKREKRRSSAGGRDVGAWVPLPEYFKAANDKTFSFRRGKN